METNEILNTARRKAETWLNPAYDEATRAEARRMLDAEDPTELIESFYNDLEFGTGGLRGIMGVGSNRMNVYTVGAATQGFANYINQAFPDGDKAVCIGHDCRHNSRLFAETAARIFTANGIRVYLFEELRPTPEMSFAIRELGCKGGVIITASHNPKEYNGYKAYWDDGSQLVPPHDKNVIAEVKKVSVDDIRFNGDDSLVTLLGKEFDDRYLARVKTLSLSPEAIREADDLRVVFTPLHGTTYRLVPESLRLWGFRHVYTVPEQSVPDGDFPTVASANPEEPAAFRMALDLARQVDADLAMACDPDGDRIGIAVKDDSGEWTLLNGNQTDLIFTEYIISRRRALGLLREGDYIVKTIVTTEMLKEIAERNGVTCYDVYTGFKWIAAVVRQQGGEHYIGGGEESFGYMPGAFTRDKDGVSAASLMAEITAWLKVQGKTPFEYLKEIYAKYGFSQERMIYIVRKGLSGAEEIKAMMQRFRHDTPATIAGSPVILKKDYLTLEATDILLRRNAADIILLGDEEKIRSEAHKLGANIEGATIINPATSPDLDNYANSYYEFRKQKGVTPERAHDVMLDATYYGTMMVKLGAADGMVSGSINTTAHTIRPAFEFIKTKPGFSVVSSVFLMCLSDRVLVFGDCAVNPNPTADQLAEIAITSAHTAKVFGIEPRVAMLSYSTGSSGKGADVDVVIEATKIAKEKAPDLLIEGPLQYDAAIDPVVARTKAPNSNVAGKATVFIFPDLNTGNNTYKAVQRAAGAIAIGPVLQGLKKPVNDLSRGCLVADIVNTVIITAIQAAAESK